MQAGQFQSGRQARRWPQVAARALLSAAALAWVLHVTPLRTILSALNAADLPLLLGGLMLNFFARLAAAERTLIVSRALGLWISRWQTIETLFISNFYALLSPGPVLSGVVTVYRYRGYGASISASVGSLLASRAVECAAFIVLGTICVLIDPSVAIGNVHYPLAMAAGTMLAVAATLACWWLLHRRWKAGVGAGMPSPDMRPGRLAKLWAVWHELMRHGPAMAFQAAIPATAQVILASAAVELLASSLGMHLSLMSAVWITAAVYAVVLLPISVAGVGVREVTLTKALGLLGINSSLAVALSILLFADPLINALIGGLLQLKSAVAGVQRQT
jgi:uncharacterized membrane protein YbhN (UPF0104 family)